ncbi:MAG: N-acetyltransferase [Thermoplasmatota archaeon]
MFTVRQFEPKDMFAVINLASKILSERYSPTLYTYFYETSPEGFLVAEENHKIIGFAIGIKQNSNQGRIVMIGTQTTKQKKGVGSLLLQKLLSYFVSIQVQFIELEVKTSNTNAVRFYQRHHFKIIETIPQFYQNGESAYIMRRICFPGRDG